MNCGGCGGCAGSLDEHSRSQSIGGQGCVESQAGPANASRDRVFGAGIDHYRKTYRVENIKDVPVRLTLELKRRQRECAAGVRRGAVEVTV